MEVRVWGKKGVQAQDDHLLVPAALIFIIEPLCDLAGLNSANICGIFPESNQHFQVSIQSYLGARELIIRR